MSEKEILLLSAIRRDITVSAGARDQDGAPSWVIYDPMQQRYFHINRESKAVMDHWREGLTHAQLGELVDVQSGIRLDDEQISGFLNFLTRNQLLVEPEGADWKKISEEASKKNQNFSRKILQNYVFFKVPLFRPQQFLNSTVQFVNFAFSRWFYFLAILSGLFGLYFVSRDWITFSSDLQRFLSFEGIAYFGIAIIAVKVFHEFGHAFTAVRFGCRVPTMGAAFFLLTPLLYTDVSDAWRLSERRKRLLISAAGIITELVIACFATLLWVFMAAGLTRDLVLILATTSWVMSLVINLNPLIKFDGYYLLSDLIGVDNLQQRSFAFGKWRMRKFLIAPDLEPPEPMSRSFQTGLTIFAWMTWIYRVILFTTIALLVYYFAFKLLGIFLLALEIWLLILKPVIQELRQWPNLASTSGSRKRVVSTVVGAVVIALFLIVPWSGRIEIPAVLQASELAHIYPGKSSKVVSIHVSRGSQVVFGTPIITLLSPRLENKIKISRVEITRLELQMANAMLAQIGIEELLVLRRALQSEQSKLAGLKVEKSELVIRAPIAGIVQELNPQIHPGRWIGKEDQIALIAKQKQQIVKGYIVETRLQQLQADANGKFIPDDLTQSAFLVTLNTVAHAGTSNLEIQMLASQFGGAISVEKNRDNRLVPTQAQYLVELQPDDLQMPQNQMVRGIVELQGKPESFVASAFRQVAKVLIRETGF